MYYICIIYVLYMYYICIIYVLYVYNMCFCWLFLGFLRPRRFLSVFLLFFCWLFLGFLRPRRFLSVLLLAFAGFSWVLTKGIVDEDVEHHRSTKQPAKFSHRAGGTTGGTTGPPESDSGGTEGGNQIQSHSLLTPVGSADPRFI